MPFPDGEPDFGPWRQIPVSRFVHELTADLKPPAIVAVDGRSAGGKTTTAGRMAAALPGATVVHTDDIAWHRSFFDWADPLIDNVLNPTRAGEAVRFRPPAWVARDRPGAIEVPAGARWIILEGVGAARRELTEMLDVIVWVQSDFVQARERGIGRDGGTEAAEAFWDEWMAEEVPFLAHHRPWERARAIVNGTASISHPDTITAAWPPRPA